MIKWFKIADGTGKDIRPILMTVIPDKVHLENNNQTLRITVDPAEWKDYRGKYRCEVNNGYSSEMAEADLIVEMPPTSSPAFIASDVTTDPVGGLTLSIN